MSNTLKICKIFIAFIIKNIYKKNDLKLAKLKIAEGQNLKKFENHLFIEPTESSSLSCVNSTLRNPDPAICQGKLDWNDFPPPTMA